MEKNDFIEYVLRNLDQIINDADWTRLKLFRGELRTLATLLEKLPSYVHKELLDVFYEKENNDAE